MPTDSRWWSRQRSDHRATGTFIAFLHFSKVVPVALESKLSCRRPPLSVSGWNSTSPCPEKINYCRRLPVGNQIPSFGPHYCNLNVINGRRTSLRFHLRQSHHSTVEHADTNEWKLSRLLTAIGIEKPPNHLIEIACTVCNTRRFNDADGRRYLPTSSKILAQDHDKNCHFCARVSTICLSSSRDVPPPQKKPHETEEIEILLQCLQKAKKKPQRYTTRFGSYSVIDLCSPEGGSSAAGGDTRWRQRLATNLRN